MASGMVKNISMGGPGWQNRPDHSFINDYLYTPTGGESNRSFVVRSATPIVTLWVNWNAMQGGEDPNWPVPGNYGASWAQLEANNAAWRILDEQIVAASQDGRAVMVRVYQSYPRWARVQGTPPGALKADAALPVNTTTNGPWAWFISYLCGRYKPGAPINARGPHAPGPGEGLEALFGNPLGAGILTLAPMNEINLLSWGRNRVDATAEMIRTASAYRDFLNSPPTLLVPDMDDTARLDSNGNIYPPDTYPFDTYCAGVLARLQLTFLPVGFVGWSMHNYFDVKYRSTDPVTDTHAWFVRGQLYSKLWKGPLADRALYLTEGGLDIRGSETEGDQKTKCLANFNMMRGMPDVVMWTNHAIRTIDTTQFDAAFFAGDRLRPWGTTWVPLRG